MILQRGDKIHLWATTKSPETIPADRKFYEDLYRQQGVEIVGFTFTHGIDMAAPKVVAVFRNP